MVFSSFVTVFVIDESVVDFWIDGISSILVVLEWIELAILLQSPPVFCGDNGLLCNDDVLVEVRDNLPLLENDDGVDADVEKSIFSLVFRLNKIGSLGSICTIEAGMFTAILELEPLREITRGDRPSSLLASPADEFFLLGFGGDLVDVEPAMGSPSDVGFDV
jgi:hypothetical protein